MKDLWSTNPDYRRQFQNEGEIERVLKLLDLGRASALADIGCGNGAFAIAAAREHPGCRVWAFDALASAVEACRARAGGSLVNLRIGVAQAEALPLADRSMDRVLCRAVLHHVHDPHAAYREMSRILKPGGLLHLQAPCNRLDAAFGELMGELYWLMDDSHRRHFYAPDRVIRDLSEAGFALRRAECWPYKMDELNAAQLRLLRERGAAEKVRLVQADGAWSAQFSWLGVLADKV